MSGCVEVAQVLGLPVEPSLPTVPDLCCARCHDPRSAPLSPFVLDGVEYRLCCRMFAAYNTMRATRP